MTENSQESLAFSSGLSSRRGSVSRSSKDTFVTISVLFDLLETKVSSDKIERELLLSLSEKTRKNRDNRFSLQELSSICTETLAQMKEQINLTWAQLQKFLSEKQEIERKTEEAKKTERNKRSQALYNDLLRMKVCEVKNFPIPQGEKIFIRISCEDIVFSTRLHEYLNSSFEEAFYELFIKTGLEKVKVEALISRHTSNNQNEVLGEFEIPVNDSNLETEQDGWYLLRSKKDGRPPCGEVRLSLKLVPLRIEFLKYSTEEVEHKIFNQTQEVEGLERSFKNLTFITSLLKDLNFSNAILEKSLASLTQEKKYSSVNTLSAIRDVDIIDEQRLINSAVRGSSREKKRVLPPLAFQNVGKGSEAKYDSATRNKVRSPSPGKEIQTRDFNSTSRIDHTEGVPRNSLAQLYNIFMSPTDFNTRMSETKALSTKRESQTVEWEADLNLESSRAHGNSSKDQTSWKKENLRLHGMIKSLQEENKVLLNEVKKLKDTEQKVNECKDKMSVLIGELNRVQGLAREKEEEAMFWRQQSEKNLGFDVKEVQGRIQKLVDENQRLRDIATKSHNESVYYKKQCELYGGNKDTIDGLVKEIEVLRTVNQNLNLEQFERTEFIEELQKENNSLKENNKTFSNELAKRDAVVNKLKKEVDGFNNMNTQSNVVNTRSSIKGYRLQTDENINKPEARRNPLFQPLQPWNFLNNEKGH